MHFVMVKTKRHLFAETSQPDNKEDFFKDFLPETTITGSCIEKVSTFVGTKA